MLIEENKPLAPFTTFGIGGPARWFVQAASEDEIAEAAAWAGERGVALFVLGGGSNLLVSDAGFKGLVLRMALRGITASPLLDFGSESCQGTTSVVPQTPQNKCGALQAAEKGLFPGDTLEKHPSGPKGHLDFAALTARLKPCPDTKQPLEADSTSFSAACLASETHPSADSSSVQEHSGQVIYRAAAGEDWDAFVERAVQDHCAGVECLAGIPGTVGGTPVQNVGAYGQEVSSAIERVRSFDLQEHAFVEFAAAECGFSYRRSRFNSADRGRYVVTRVDYRLTPGGAPTVRYADLQRVLAESRKDGMEPTLAEVAAVVRRVRQSKGMLMVEGDSDCRSAGSFFKNPVVNEKQLRQIAAGSEKEPPRFPAGSGTENQGWVKVPAAWLIEQAGFAKGYARGSAAISSRHTLALTNRGGASAADILALAAEITAAVEARFGIRLEMEPVMLGF